MQWLEFVEKLGIPTAFAMGLLWIIWKTIKACAPFAQSLFDRHTQHLEKLEKTLEVNTELNETNSGLLGDLTDLQRDETKALKHVASAIESLAPPDKEKAVKAHTDAAKENLK